MDRAQLLIVPKDGREAATRFAVVAFFAEQKIPSLAELAEWSGLPPGIALSTLRKWHPVLAEIIEEAR